MRCHVINAMGISLKFEYNKCITCGAEVNEENGLSFLKLYKLSLFDFPNNRKWNKHLLSCTCLY